MEAAIAVIQVGAALVSAARKPADIRYERVRYWIPHRPGEVSGDVMAAVAARGPDVWLVPDSGDEDLWAAGTILGTNRAVVHAPLRLFERPAGSLVLITSGDGQPEPFVGVVPEVMILGEGLRPGHVFALLRIEGTELRAQPDVIDDLVRAAVSRRVPLAADRRADENNPEAPQPPSVPRPQRAGAPAPDVRIGRVPDEVARQWYCYITPWHCMPAGPRPKPDGPSVSHGERPLPPGP